MEARLPAAIWRQSDCRHGPRYRTLEPLMRLLQAPSWLLSRGGFCRLPDVVEGCLCDVEGSAEGGLPWLVGRRLLSLGRGAMGLWLRGTWRVRGWMWRCWIGGAVTEEWFPGFHISMPYRFGRQGFPPHPNPLPQGEGTFDPTVGRRPS